VKELMEVKQYNNTLCYDIPAEEKEYTKILKKIRKNPTQLVFYDKQEGKYIFIAAKKVRAIYYSRFFNSWLLTGGKSVLHSKYLKTIFKSLMQDMMSWGNK
jgi:hypothetical protein